MSIPVPQQWRTDPNVPAPGWWWDGEKWRTINPSAPYPAGKSPASTHAIGTSYATLVVLAGLGVIAGAFVLAALWKPLVWGALAGFAVVILGLTLYGASNGVKGFAAVRGYKDARKVRDAMSDTYSGPAPDGWAAVEAREVQALHVFSEGVLQGTFNTSAGNSLFPTTAWTAGRAVVSGCVSATPMTMALRTVEVNDVPNFYPRHVGVYLLPGGYALPPLHIAPEGAVAKTVATVAGSDRNTAMAAFNKAFTVSADARDHPLLEPHLVDLLNSSRSRGYVYHFEGNMVIVAAQAPDADPVHLGAHLLDVVSTMPAYLYE